MKSKSGEKANKAKAVVYIAVAAILVAISALGVLYVYNEKTNVPVAMRADTGEQIIMNIGSTQIDFSDIKLADINGIEKCEQLESVNLHDTGISDISPLLSISGLKRADLTGCELSVEQYDKMHEALPECEIAWEVPISGKRYPLDTASIDLTEIQPADYRLITYLPSLTEVNAEGCEIDGELVDIRKSMPDCTFNWHIEAFGRSIGSNEELLDLNETKVDMDELVNAVELLPGLKRVELCDSGFTNRQMEGLIAQFPEIKFVWRVYFGYWDLRTDATNFSTAHLFRLGKVIDPESAQVLKYCTDLVALDLGHNPIRDISFITSLKKLRSLILVDCEIKDISPLRELPNLEYVELFENELVDISPLAKLNTIKELNVTKNRIEDLSPLYGLTNLEKLWVGMNPTSDEQKELIAANAPEGCIVTIKMGKHPCSEGWRPLDYRLWGFEYLHPNNAGMINKMNDIKVSTTSAHIDPYAYSDE